MTDPLLLGADVLVLRGGEIRTPAGEVLAVVETRGPGGARTLLRELYRWTSYRKRGLRHLAHRLAVRSPGGEPLFDVDKRHDRAFRRVLLWVYGPDGLPIGRVERIRNVPVAGGLRLVGNDGRSTSTC
jgi:hypothetical protein